MKIVSFSTQEISTGEPYDLSIFLQFTEESYRTFLSIPPTSPHELYDQACVLAEGLWNDGVYGDLDDVVIDGSIFEHTTDQYITPEYTFD